MDRAHRAQDREPTVNWIRPTAMALLGAFTTWLLVPGRLGLAGSVAAALAVLLLAVRSRPAARHHIQTISPDPYRVAVHLRLHLSAGASLVDALALTERTTSEPLAGALRRARIALALGGRDDEAWKALMAEPMLRRVAVALASAYTSGAPATMTLDLAARDIHARRTSALVRQARVAPVRVLAPLGLCFLPAFVLVGVVPVIVGLGRTMVEVP